MKAALRTLFAVFFIAAGINHFVSPDFYRPMMPDYLPAHGALIFLSGVAEVLGGIGLLVAATRRYAAWGIIALLVAVFPAHIHMLQHPEAFEIPKWALIVRLPLQGLLVAWAYVYKRRH